MQPAASVADGAGGVKMTKGEVADDAGRMNEEGWLRRKVKDVPVDQVFFHKYFTKKKEKEEEKASKIGKRKGQHGDISDEDEDEDDTDEEQAQSASEDRGDGPKAVDAAEEDEEVDSDEEEAEIWKAMKATMPAELQDDDLMEDSDDEDEDDIPSDLDDDSELAEGEGNEQSEADSVREEEEEEDGDAFSLAEGSDADDLLSLNDDVPEGMGLIEYDGSDASDQEEEWGGISEQKGKRKREEESGKARKKKLRSLPTFASYEDYARMIEDGPEDNI